MQAKVTRSSSTVTKTRLCSLFHAWYDPTYERMVRKVPIGPNPFDLTEEEERKVESQLIGCPCGGRFSFKNPLICPVCGEVFSDPPKLSWSEVVVVIDRHIDGNKASIWRPVQS